MLRLVGRPIGAYRPSIAWVCIGFAGHHIATRLSEREAVAFCPGLEERDLYGPLENVTGHANELVQAAVFDDAVALLVDVLTAGASGWLSIEERVNGMGPH